MKPLLLFLCVFGLANGCKLEMGCAQCTSLSCFYVQLGGSTLCVEDPSSFVDIATIMTIPNQCPTTTTSTVPTSSTVPTTHQSSSSPSSHHPSTSAYTTQHPPQTSSSALLIITISIIIIMIIIIITVAGAFLCKQRQPAIKSQFSRLIDEEETAV